MLDHPVPSLPGMSHTCHILACLLPVLRFIHFRMELRPDEDSGVNPVYFIMPPTPLPFSGKQTLMQTVQALCALYLCSASRNSCSITDHFPDLNKDPISSCPASIFTEERQRFQHCSVTEWAQKLGCLWTESTGSSALWLKPSVWPAEVTFR